MTPLVVDQAAAPATGPLLWPLFGLRVSTPAVELAPVRDDDLDELAELAAAGIHEPERPPFSNLWTDCGGADFRRGFAQYFWRQRSAWSPSAWALPFAVRVDGRLAGVQQIEAVDFLVRRTVSSGSWLARSCQGRGIGTAMRAAALAFAFEWLEAEVAVTGAYDYNIASLRVSEKLGYEPNGERTDTVRGRPARALLLRLEREAWRAAAWPGVDVAGFDAARELFGVATPAR